MTAADMSPGAGRAAGVRPQVGPPAPVILHSGKRTGGTALAAALRQEPALHLWFDPLSNALAEPFERWAAFSPDHWASGHPPEMGPYFAEYAEAARAAALPPPALFDPARAFLGARDEHPALQSYLDALFALAAARGRRAVLKTEQAEGMIPWLRARYPAVVHIGLVRDPAAQFASWLDQLALHENGFFFRYAHSLVEADPGRFGLSAAPQLMLDNADFLSALFDRVEGVLGPLRREAVDLALDIAPESSERPELQDAALEGLLGEGAQPFIEALRRVREGSPAADRGALSRFRVVGELRERLAVAEVEAAGAQEACRKRDAAAAEVLSLGRQLAAAGAGLALATATADARRRATQLAQAGLVAQRDSARAEVAALRDSARAEVAALRDSARAEVAALRDQLATARAANDLATAQLAEVSASRSWRLTAPLRGASAAVRRAAGRGARG